MPANNFLYAAFLFFGALITHFADTPFIAFFPTLFSDVFEDKSIVSSLLHPLNVLSAIFTTFFPSFMLVIFLLPANAEALTSVTLYVRLESILAVLRIMREIFWRQVYPI